VIRELLAAVGATRLQMQQASKAQEALQEQIRELQVSRFISSLFPCLARASLILYMTGCTHAAFCGLRKT
jgi:hypothetical protein